MGESACPGPQDCADSKRLVISVGCGHNLETENRNRKRNHKHPQVRRPQQAVRRPRCLSYCNSGYSGITICGFFLPAVYRFTNSLTSADRSRPVPTPTPAPHRGAQGVPAPCPRKCASCATAPRASRPTPRKRLGHLRTRESSATRTTGGLVPGFPNSDEKYGR